MNYKIENRNLDKEYIDSKRSGFIETTGTINGEANGTKYQISSYRNGNFPMKVEIITADTHIIFYEVSGQMFIRKSSNNWEVETKSFPLVHQSSLTNKVAEDILINGKIRLPTYKESSRIHIPMIKSFLNYLYKVDGILYDKCPIT
tara:strand:+ start:64 stop:501 length:438 start_codon:yes stop_codon:yes gene_type:complete